MNNAIQQEQNSVLNQVTLEQTVAIETASTKLSKAAAAVAAAYAPLTEITDLIQEQVTQIEVNESKLAEFDVLKRNRLAEIEAEAEARKKALDLQHNNDVRQARINFDLRFSEHRESVIAEYAEQNDAEFVQKGTVEELTSTFESQLAEEKLKGERTAAQLANKHEKELEALEEKLKLENNAANAQMQAQLEQQKETIVRLEHALQGAEERADKDREAFTQVASSQPTINTQSAR